MTRKSVKEYHRWDFEDEETEMGVDEEEMNDDNDEMIISANSMTTFVQPNASNGNGTLFEGLSHHHHSFLHQAQPRRSCREKVHILCVILGLFLVGFLLGTILTLSKSKDVTSGHHASPSMTRSDAHGLTQPTPQMILSPPSTPNNNSLFPKILAQVTAENIRHNLKRMSQEAHTAGTLEGKSMAMAIRDLWRSYGLSVRFEQHKALITKTETFNFLEVYDGNGSVSWRTSLVSDDAKLPSARPLIAFSPPANLNGTLIYGHYGTIQDFQLLQRQGIVLHGAVALLRFGSTHLSQVVAAAVSFGVSGLVFYPDPVDFGPHMPGNAVRRDSLLSLSQFHDHSKRRERALLPAHTISSNDARNLLRLLRASDVRSTRSPWTGGLVRDFYPLGGSLRIGLHIFNEGKMSTIYNVVAAIPGAWESDRYVIVGCAHDSWSYGAGDPGIGIAVTTELARSFESTVQSGWRPRRSILFISWDAHLYASSGVSHWLQEHHFEIWSRAVAYIDLSRLLQGNQTLHVVSSPLLREVARKAIQRVKEMDALLVSSKKINSGGSGGILFSSTLTGDEASFAFFGNLGVPFIRFSVSNAPKGWDYPLFNTAFDTFDNFSNLVDPTFTGAETLGRIISGLVLLLVDSSLLPMNVEDYVEEIQRSFGSFMAHYQEDFHRANLSIAYLQAAVMRLEVIGDNFRTDIHNRSVVNPEHDPEYDVSSTPSASRHLTTTKKLLFHRIINDKLMELERAFLSRKSEPYKHQVLGFSSCSRISQDDNCTVEWSSAALRHTFPRLRQVLECRRHQGEEGCPSNDELALEVAALIRALDAAAATLQSPLLPEESDSSIT